AATLRQAAEALGRAFVAVTAAAGPRVPSARLRELSLRERALRDGSRTRPDRELARLLDEVGEQLLVRLDALSRTAPRAHARRVPPGALIVRDVERQRLLVHRLAKMHAVQCLGFDSIPAPLRLAMRAEFGHRLASFDPMARSPELQTELAMLRAQWGLLTVALDSNADGGCGGAALAQVAASSEWLAQLLEEFGEAARRPQA
ncbi:MAG TPA: hypothetical protein VM491_23565, partial [Burkholderiaceae bacterium]|nr:hypothetical protein [Burkholderiaceae bacterium]